MWKCVLAECVSSLSLLFKCTLWDNPPHVSFHTVLHPIRRNKRWHAIVECSSKSDWFPNTPNVVPSDKLNRFILAVGADEFHSQAVLWKQFPAWQKSSLIFFSLSLRIWFVHCKVFELALDTENWYCGTNFVWLIWIFHACLLSRFWPHQ